MSERPGMVAFLASLDLNDELRAAKRRETWIFVRMLLILLVVLVAVFIRSLLL